MLELLSRSPRKSVLTRRRRAPLGVEQLETRYCPSGLQFLSFTAVPMNTGKWVDLHGVISDPNPTTVVVSFNGVASGSASPDANGVFDLQTIASGLGVVTAAGTDQGGSTASASATVSATAPTLTLNLAYGPNKQVTLSGLVTDAQRTGMTVNFSGVVTGTATVKADGTYSATFTPSALGQITAITQDVWGLSSPAASVMVTNSAPTITLSATQVGNIWTFSGRVTDEYAPGLTVTFRGPGAVNGKTAVVQSDGTYSLTVTLTAADTGWVYATVTDWWGLASTADVLISNPTGVGGGG